MALSIEILDITFKIFTEGKRDGLCSTNLLACTTENNTIVWICNSHSWTTPQSFLNFCGCENIFRTKIITATATVA